jgi:hypothetical protein
MCQHTLEVSGSLSALICLCVCARTQVGLREWEKFNKFCTHCICKATGKKRIYQLINLDSEHNDDKVSKKAESNLTRVEDDDTSASIPHGPPSTLENQL